MSELLRVENLLPLWQTNVQDTLTWHSDDGVRRQQTITRVCSVDHVDRRLLSVIFLSAEPLCIAIWSVLSLWIKYCGSFFEARTV